MVRVEAAGEVELKVDGFAVRVDHGARESCASAATDPRYAQRHLYGRSLDQLEPNHIAGLVLTQRAMRGGGGPTPLVVQYASR
jgi:hypothetical protein